MIVFHTKSLTKFLTLISFFIMILVNFLANSIPLNGVSTGNVAARYPNLFTPASFTFAIWGLIYLLLAMYVIFQLQKTKDDTDGNHIKAFFKIRILFILSCLLNILWIFAWHYDYIVFSMLLMLGLLVSLISIYHILHTLTLNLQEKIFMKIPFSIYLGWISVAAIANMMVLLVRLGWNSAGTGAVIITILILVACALIGSFITLTQKDIFYGLVFLWAYSGILVRHLSSEGLNRQYPAIIIVLILSLLILAGSMLYTLFSKKKMSSEA